MEEVTLPDLQNTLGELEKSFFDGSAPVPQPISDVDVVVGEHIAVFWIVKGVPGWFLAIVSDEHEDEIDVLPLCPSPRKKKSE